MVSISTPYRAEAQGEKTMLTDDFMTDDEYVEAFLKNQKRRVILVGRHVSDLPERIEVVSQENILWATNFYEAQRQFQELMLRADKAQAGILFQNVPGILAAVLLRTPCDIQLGVIISIPGERQAGVSKSWQIAAEDAAIVESAVTFANGRAKVEIDGATVTVTVDPVTPFVLSHVEWFPGYR